MLVLGIDPVASAMAEASRRAARPVRKGGVPNAGFVVASAEASPPELAGLARRVTVNLPWGSLLRGALALDPAVAAGIAGLLRPGGVAELLVAPAARNRLAADVDVAARVADSLEADWRSLGMAVEEARPATGADLAATRTTWGRRLGLSPAVGGGHAGPVAWRGGAAVRDAGVVAGRGGAAGREPWRLVLRRSEGP
jgi:16S rRNA (adenine(1408)-N(1))-methyltransferase